MAVGQPGELRDAIIQMNALLVGYGSIGRRHLRNLMKVDAVKEVVVYSKIKESSKEIVGKNVSFIDASNVDLDSVSDYNKVDFAIIANETYKHIDTAILLAQKGIHLFIEKPLSHNLKKVAALKSIVRKNKLKVFVAYNLRFLPAMQYLKEQLSQKIIGNVYFAQIEVGQYLPSWRPNVAYIDSYSSSTAYGGGAALDLSHEVDYMRYLFGEPNLWKTIKSKAGELNIDSDDIFEGIYKYEQGFVCHVHMDYLQREATRKLRIVGSEGEIICDFVGKWMVISLTDRKIELKEEELFNIENTYRAELEHFIQTIKESMKPAIVIDDGINALALLEDSNDREP